MARDNSEQSLEWTFIKTENKWMIYINYILVNLLQQQFFTKY